MRVRYRQTTNMSSKAFGYLFAGVGVLAILFMIGMIILFKVSESKVPDDAEWFDGVITEVLSVETDYEWREDSDGDDYKVRVYDCEAYLEYEIDGQTYVYKHTTNNSDDPIREGEHYYVKVSPSNPNKIYVISTSKSNWGIYVGAGIFGLVGIIFVIAGLCTAKSAGKKMSINNTTYTQANPGNMSNVGQPYNMGQPYNVGQSYNVGQPYNAGQTYNNVGSNSQEYDYYTNNQTTDYSGTSLRD